MTWVMTEKTQGLIVLLILCFTPLFCFRFHSFLVIPLAFTPWCLKEGNWRQYTIVYRSSGGGHFHCITLWWNKIDVEWDRKRSQQKESREYFMRLRSRPRDQDQGWLILIQSLSFIFNWWWNCFFLVNQMRQVIGIDGLDSGIAIQTRLECCSRCLLRCLSCNEFFSEGIKMIMREKKLYWNDKITSFRRIQEGSPV